MRSQAGSANQNKMASRPPNLLAPPQPKKSRPNNSSGESVATHTGIPLSTWLVDVLFHIIFIVYKSSRTSSHNMDQPLQFNSVPCTTASGRVHTGESSPSLVVYTAPPSSVTAEGMKSVTRTVPNSSTPLTASQPGSVPQRTPIQQEATQVTPSLVRASPFTVNQGKPFSIIAGQPTPSVGSQQHAPPTATSGAAEGLTPESTQQQPCVPQPGPQLGSDVSVACTCTAITHCSSMLCSMERFYGFCQDLLEK